MLVLSFPTLMMFFLWRNELCKHPFIHSLIHTNKYMIQFYCSLPEVYSNFITSPARCVTILFALLEDMVSVMDKIKVKTNGILYGGSRMVDSNENSLD